jgi:hypothetical protein
MKRKPYIAGRGWRSAIFFVASVVVLALCALVSTPASAQDQAPDLATYTGWVREAHAAAQRNDRLGLEQVTGRLTATTSVRLPDGARIGVDNGWLRDAMKESEPDLPAVAERLGAIINALDQPTSAAPADARERLKQILDRPPFKRAEDPQPPSWLRDFFDWLGRLLESMIRPIGSVSPATGQTVGWVVIVVGILLLLGLLGYLLLGLRRGMAAEASTAEDDPEANLTARTALDQAGDLARGGDYRTAVRYLYLSALLWLDERDVLRYDRALTNREYLERVRDNPALRARMAPIVETFDRVWYGHLPIDAEAFAAYEQQIEALRREGVKGERVTG